MWTTEHAIETTATLEAIWEIWADVPHWGEWNPDIERIEISGAFEAGSTITMTPGGQEAIELRLAGAGWRGGDRAGAGGGGRAGGLRRPGRPRRRRRPHHAPHRAARRRSLARRL